ncbi:MAG: t [Marmoricola sp.]|nr:t [Marmoricola sp.]
MTGPSTAARSGRPAGTSLIDLVLPELAIAVLAGAMAWLSLWSWRGLIEEPERVIDPAFAATFLVVAVGVLGRTLRIVWFATFAAQVVVVLLWFHHHFAIGGAVGGWVPTPSSTSNLASQVRHGAATVDKYRSPVLAAHTDAVVYLVAASLLVLLAVDLIACGLRRAPWSGIPVLIAMSIPISVLDTRLSPVVFVGVALLFVVLLAAVETDRVLDWGQTVTGRRSRPGETERILDRTSVSGRAFRIGVVTAAAALVLPVLVPVADGFLNRDHGKRGGSGHTSRVTLTNPLVTMQRDLVRHDHEVLLYAKTDAPDPTYVKTTVLDKFNGEAWYPSARDLPVSNRATGRLPDPAGIDFTTRGITSSWSMQLSESFSTSWLPVPYSTRTIQIDSGDWRYAEPTLDIADAGGHASLGTVSYQLTALAPQYAADDLDAANPAPESIQGPMTALPKDLPAEVRTIARQVTASGTTPYAKAVLLQNWFRTGGGFTYSLAQQDGDGEAELLRFITTDKSGFCEQFAAAMAVMARSLGIPARVAVGFLQPEPSDAGIYNYTYTSDDLHAWPEIYLRGSGWVRFEPTPSIRTGPAPPWTQQQVASPPTTQTPTAQPSIARPRPTPGVATDQPVATSSHSNRWTSAPAIVAGLLVLLLLAAGPRLLRSSQRRRRLRPDDDAVVEHAWDELRATAIDLGVPWPEGRSAREIGAVLVRQASALPDDVRLLERFVELLERARYAEEFSLDDDSRAHVVATVERWTDLLTAAVSRQSARMAQVLPRSLWDRKRPVGAEPPSSTMTEVS